MTGCTVQKHISTYLYFDVLLIVQELKAIFKFPLTAVTQDIWVKKIYIYITNEYTTEQPEPLGLNLGTNSHTKENTAIVRAVFFWQALSTIPNSVLPSQRSLPPSKSHFTAHNLQCPVELGFSFLSFFFELDGLDNAFVFPFCESIFLHTEVCKEPRYKVQSYRGSQVWESSTTVGFWMQVEMAGCFCLIVLQLSRRRGRDKENSEKAFEKTTLYAAKATSTKAIFQWSHGQPSTELYLCPCHFDGTHNVALPGTLAI